MTLLGAVAILELIMLFLLFALMEKVNVMAQKVMQEKLDADRIWGEAITTLDRAGDVYNSIACMLAERDDG